MSRRRANPDPAVDVAIDRVNGTVREEDVRRIRAHASRIEQKLRAAPGDRGLVISLAKSLIDLGRFAEAESLLEKARAEKPDDVVVYCLLSRLYERKRRREDAET